MVIYYCKDCGAELDTEEICCAGSKVKLCGCGSEQELEVNELICDKCKDDLK